jgi:hypothetical protein
MGRPQACSERIGRRRAPALFEEKQAMDAELVNRAEAIQQRVLLLRDSL